jgi:hypothetical protein
MKRAERKYEREQKLKITDGPIFKMPDRDEEAERDSRGARVYEITEIHWRDKFGTLMWIEPMVFSRLFGRGDVITEKRHAYHVLRVAIADHVQHINLNVISMHTAKDAKAVLDSWQARLALQKQKEKEEANHGKEDKPVRVQDKRKRSRVSRRKDG